MSLLLPLGPFMKLIHVWSSFSFNPEDIQSNMIMTNNKVASLVGTFQLFHIQIYKRTASVTYKSAHAQKSPSLHSAFRQFKSTYSHN